jgi:hypothetical protein
MLGIITPAIAAAASADLKVNFIEVSWFEEQPRQRHADECTRGIF